MGQKSLNPALGAGVWPLEMIPIPVFHCSVLNAAGRFVQLLQAQRFCACSKAAEFLQAEPVPAAGHGWLLSTTPTFLKQVINVNSSFEYPQLHKNIGDKLSGTQTSVGQSKTKMLYNQTFLLLSPTHR